MASLSTKTAESPPFAEQPSDLEVGHAVEVRRGPEHPLTGHETGHTDPEAPALPQLVGQLDQRVDQPAEAVGTSRRRPLSRGDDVAAGVERDALRLGSADVDAHPPGRTGGVGHASARTFSSRTVLRMRTSARRFTKPGSGTARSIWRS